MLVGGSAAPRAMIAGFKQRHGLTVVHGWGMTETSPVASIAALPGELADADEETQFDYIALQGLPLPFVELRARDADGHEVPWDGETMGELEVRGPWVAAGYFDDARAGRSLDRRRLVQDGRHRLDPPARVHPASSDRAKDVIKSGGEWISSVALENALMGHPAVAEAAVIAVPEREVGRAAARGRRPARGADGDRRTSCASSCSGSFAKWWLPDALRVRRRDPEDRASASSARRRCASGSRRRPVFRSALVTGSASGIGAAAVALLERDGVEVLGLDLADGFDVGDPAAWAAVGPVDFAFLNAGVATGAGGVAELGDAKYRRSRRGERRRRRLRRRGGWRR